MDDQQELYMIFNLFEKLEPAPHHKTALDAFQAMADNVTTHKEFEEGIFLQNVDDSSKYKFMNYCMYNSKEHASFKKDPEFLKMVRSHAPVTVAAPGGFTEVGTIADPPIAKNALPKFNPNPNAGYFIHAIPREEGEKDEVNWAGWSGATFMQENIPAELKTRRITLHKNFTTAPFNTFGYIVQAECDEMLSNLDVAKQFVAKCAGLGDGNRYTGIFRKAILYTKKVAK